MPFEYLDEVKSTPEKLTGKISSGSKFQYLDQPISTDAEVQAALSPLMRRGGIGMPLSPELARSIAAERLATRDPGVALVRELGIDAPNGEQLALPSPTVAALYGLGSGMTLGASDAALRVEQDLLNKAGLFTPEQQKVLGVQEVQAANPGTSQLAQFAGSFNPAGIGGVLARSVQGAKGVIPTILRSGVGGFVAGFPMGVSQEITQKGLETSPVDAAVRGLITGSKTAGESALVLGGTAAIPPTLRAVISPKQALRDAGFTRPLTAPYADTYANITKPSESKGGSLNFLASVKNGGLEEGLQNIAEHERGVPNTVEQFKDNAYETASKKGSEITPRLKQEKYSDVSIKADELKAGMDEAVSSELLNIENPTIRERVGNIANEFFSKDMSPSVAFEKLKDLNARRRSFYNKSLEGRATDLDNALNDAYQTARDLLSTRLDETVRGIEGVDSNFIREYGNVIQIADSLAERYANVAVKTMEKSGGGLFAGVEPTKGIGGIGHSIYRKTKQPIDILRGGELGRLDRQVKTLFEKLPKKQAPKKLTNAERENLLAGKEINAQPQDINQLIVNDAELYKQNTINDILKSSGYKNANPTTKRMLLEGLQAQTPEQLGYRPSGLVNQAVQESIGP